MNTKSVRLCNFKINFCFFVIFLFFWGNNIILSTANAAVTFSENTTIDVDDTTYDGQDIMINGAVITIDGKHIFNSIYIKAGSSLTHSAGQPGFDLTITGDLTVEVGGFISGDGKGYKFR